MRTVENGVAGTPGRDATTGAVERHAKYCGTADGGTVLEHPRMERMDGEVSNDARTALLKAQTALKTREATSLRAVQLTNNPSGWPRSSAYFNFFSFAGGIPIVVDGQMIGAVGVSGGAGGDAGSDENYAIEGLKTTFGARVTPPVCPAAAGGAPRG